MIVAPHPAPFTDVIIKRFAEIVDEYTRYSQDTALVLDPFAGVGGVHKIPALIPSNGLLTVLTCGVEIEPNWAHAHSRTIVGSALNLPFEGPFDFIVTSPCYGNRMADHHNAKDGSKRITYRHFYGKPLTEGSAAMMQWGHEYRWFHRAAWVEAKRVLTPGGIFAVNISNHIRKGQEMPVVEWHLETLLSLGLFVERVEQIATPRMRNGANAQLRVPFEHILVMRKP